MNALKNKFRWINVFKGKFFLVFVGYSEGLAIHSLEGAVYLITHN
jgi:hypothetical protein